MIQSLGKKIIVKVIEQEKKTKSGLIIPDTVRKEDEIVAEVVSVGEEVTTVKIGDKVLCSKYYTGEVINFNDEKLVSLDISSLLGVIK